MTLSNRRFASELPTWIREWAVDCRDGRTSENEKGLRATDPEKLESLWRLLSSDEVAKQLTGLDNRHASRAGSSRRDILMLLLAICEVHLFSRQLVRETPSRFKTKLTRLAAAAERLADDLEECRSFLETSLNIRYLRERLTADQPSGFVIRRRAGLRSAIYSSYPDEASLIELLTAFGDDLREEISACPKIRISSLDGGAGARVRFQIKMLKGYYTRVFGRGGDGAIAAFVTAIEACPEPIEPDRVRKTSI